MVKRREESFIFGFWNYETFEKSGVGGVAYWKDLGLNVAMMPYYSDEAELDAKLPALLDELHKNGMKLVLVIHDTDCGYLARHGKEKYREVFTAKYEKYGKHPAVLGFYPGEEPGDEVIDSFVECIKIMMEVAPELTPFIDLGANTSHMEQVAATGVKISGFGNYSQMEPEDRGTDDYFTLMNAQMKACKKYGMDCAPTLLSSAHYRFRAPNEFDYIWQINTAAACGCTGIYWFRLYDRLVGVGGDYRGSPIDEYGEPNGEYYRGMKRAQTRFNIHHGKLIMKLRHDVTYMVSKRYGGYPSLPAEGHSFLKKAYSPDNFFGCYDLKPTPAIVSFFKGEDGYEYMAVVNNTPFEPGAVVLEFDKSLKKAERVYYNGDQQINIGLQDKENLGYYREEIWLAPGQMEIIRLQ